MQIQCNVYINDAVAKTTFKQAKSIEKTTRLINGLSIRADWSFCLYMYKFSSWTVRCRGLRATNASREQQSYCDPKGTSIASLLEKMKWFVLS